MVSLNPDSRHTSALCLLLVFLILTTSKNPVLSDVHDRSVLLEVITLAGWLALSSEDNALRVGSESEVLRVLGDLLGARMPALQKKAAWAVAALSVGKNKALILSEENQNRVVRNLTGLLSASDAEGRALAARCVGCLARGSRAGQAALLRHAAGKAASSLHLALKGCAQDKAMAVRVEAAWAESMLILSTDDNDAHPKSHW